MHHFLKFYGIHREFVVRFYIFGAKFTKLPIVGRIVRALINWFAVSQHSALVLTGEEAKQVIDRAQNIAVGDCTCRKVFGNCDNPIRTDLVVGAGYDFFTEFRSDEFSQISKDEAKDIIDECSARNLVQCIIECRGKYYAICNCCTCCCVPLRLNRVYGINKVWVRDKSAVNDLLDELKGKSGFIVMAISQLVYSISILQG